MADLSVTAASVRASSAASKSTGTSGSSITGAGQPLYKDPADGKMKLADANGASPLYKTEGISLHASLDGQPITYAISDPAFTPGCTVTAGQTLIVSATPGGIAPDSDAVTGWYKTILGVGIGNNKIALNIHRADVAIP